MENKINNLFADAAVSNKTTNIASKKLFNLFKKSKSSKFIFVKSGGNFGDYLIYKGAEKIARLANISFQSVSHEEFINSKYPEGVVIYIHGGGGFNPLWSGTPIIELHKSITTHSGVTILGPQTFFTDEAYLQKFIIPIFEKSIAKKIYLFTRDITSLEALKEKVPSYVELEIDNDTALNLCAEDILRPSSCKGDFVLYAIREDKELVNIARKDFLSVWLDPIKFCKDFDHWVFLHNRAKRIITNRLHSAIVGVILGKPVELLPNSYHKNRSVWEYSLQQRGVQWSDDMPVTKITSIINSIYPLKRLVSSYKFQAWFRSLYKIH